MWVFTHKGFFSAVESREDATMVVVRARAEADIKALASELGATPLAHAGTDYPWRVIVEKAAWARWLRDAATGIDYGNFKDAVGARQGKRRASIYGEVWHVLLDLERPDT